MAEVHEECGIAAAALPAKSLKSAPKGGAAFYIVKMLLQQQHRGQLSAGLATYSQERRELIRTHRNLGTVREAFRLAHSGKAASLFEHYSGISGIGHVRYSTSGSNELSCVQPFERRHGRMWKWFSVAFNGNIANYAELKQQLEKSKYHLVREVDTEVIMHFIAKSFLGEKRREMADAFSELPQTFDGAYNIVYLNAEGTVVALRDPLGFKPLCYSIDGEDGIFAASESCALTNVAADNIHSLEPGQMLIVEDGSARVERFAKSKQKAHCMFEWVYFSNPASIIDGKNVYEARWNLGKGLAKIETLNVNSEDYIVVPVPDTARPAADALAHSLGIPSMEGLLRNRYIGRTFIEGEERARLVKDKYTVNKPVLRGKKVLLVEDSIVRGTTTKGLVNYIRREANPKEIHVRVTCPPIKCPCFYGIDMSTMTELIAPRHMGREEINATGVDASEKAIEGIRQEIGADSLLYLPIKSMLRGIDAERGEHDLCRACLSGEYPTACGKVLLEKAKAAMRKGSTKRTYS